jgi:hypothetical protein
VLKEILLCLGVMEGPCIVLAKDCLQYAFSQLFVSRAGGASDCHSYIWIIGVVGGVKYCNQSDRVEVRL